MTEPKTMVIKCKECGNSFGINPRERHLLSYLDCDKCGKDSKLNWIIEGHSEQKFWIDLEIKTTIGKK